MKREQTLVGAGVLVLGVLIAAGALQISSDAGYGGVGPNFLPWMVGGLLALCGAFLVWEALTGGFRQLEAASGADSGHWPGFIWVSAGLLANAALINTLGFIFSCTLCFVLAVRGFRSAEGRLDLSLRALLVTQALAINLPGLTSTGWL